MILLTLLSHIFKKVKKINISNKFYGEKFEEELYSIKEIPFIKTKNNLFVIDKKKISHTRNEKES